MFIGRALSLYRAAAFVNHRTPAASEPGLRKRHATCQCTDRIGYRAVCARAIRPARHGAELADARGEAHPAAWPRQRRRYRRAADRGQAVGEMGPAGGGGEPPGRRRHRRHQRIHRRQGRPCAADVADLLVHRASVSARQAALRSARPRPDRPHLQHRRRRGGAILVRHQDGEGPGRDRARQSRQAELGHHHRHVRFRVCRLPEEDGHRDRQGAVSRHGAGGERSRRGPHPGHDVGDRDRAAARAGRRDPDDRGDGGRAGLDRTRRSDHHRGRLSRYPDRGPHRLVRAARHAGGAARAHLQPM